MKFLKLINKIKSEEKETNDKISNYLKKLNYIFKTYEYNEKTDENGKDTENEENKKIQKKKKKWLKYQQI